VSDATITVPPVPGAAEHRRATGEPRRRGNPDRAEVRRVHNAAFPTTLESDLLDALRTGAGWLPRFSLVAELDGAVVGHVVGTRAWVGAAPAVGIGPLGVHPEFDQL
jgi:putative acetyltransferase